MGFDFNFKSSFFLQRGGNITRYLGLRSIGCTVHAKSLGLHMATSAKQTTQNEPEFGRLPQYLLDQAIFRHLRYPDDPLIMTMISSCHRIITAVLGGCLLSHPKTELIRIPGSMEGFSSSRAYKLGPVLSVAMTSPVFIVFILFILLSFG